MVRNRWYAQKAPAASAAVTSAITAVRGSTGRRRATCRGRGTAAWADGGAAAGGGDENLSRTPKGTIEGRSLV